MQITVFGTKKKPSEKINGDVYQEYNNSFLCFPRNLRIQLLL